MKEKGRHPLLAGTHNTYRASFEREGGGGWGGGLGRGAKVCVPKIARSDFPDCKFRFFPRWSLWSGFGGRGCGGRGSFPLGF